MKRGLICVVGALALLGASPVRAERLLISGQVPLIVPMGMSTSFGAGFTPGLQLNLTDNLGLEVISGFVYYRNEADAMELDVPVLAGVTYAFGEGRLRPFVTIKGGYTYAPDAESHHWITALAGLGGRWQATRSLQLDFALEFIVPDLRGNAEHEVGVLFKVGARYALL